MELGNQLTRKVFNPKEVIKQLNLEHGMIVADLGCGTGFLTFEAAKMVGIDGIVYAVDIQSHIISVIESGKKLYGLRNINAVMANLEILGSTGIEDSSVDFVFLATILYQVKKREEVIAEAKRIVKPQGRILIFDWRKQDISFGPNVERRISQDDVKRLAAQSKLKYIDEIEAGNFHFGLIFQK